MATRPVNALDPTLSYPPLVPDSNYTNGSGTDNSPYLQTMYARSRMTGSTPVIEVAAGEGRVYALRSTIDVPYGVWLEGKGGIIGSGIGQCAMFVWDGPEDEPVFRVRTTTQNIPTTPFKNISITSRYDGIRPASNLIEFIGEDVDQGSVDTGTYLENVFLQKCKRAGLAIRSGATNFSIKGGRFDSFGEYAIDVAGSGANITIDGNCTIASELAAKGLINLRSLRTILKLYGTHLEANASMQETIPSGVNPFDKRCLIRCEVDPALAYIQHVIYLDGVEINEPFIDINDDDILSHSVFGIDGTSSDSGLDTARMVSIVATQCTGMSRESDDASLIHQMRPIGGIIHDDERPYNSGTGYYAQLIHAIGKDSAGGHGAVWINTGHTRIKELVIPPTTLAKVRTTWKQPGATLFITDSVETLAAGMGNAVVGNGSYFVGAHINGAGAIIIG